MTARKMTRTRLTSTVAGLAAATLVLAACGDNGGDEGEDSGNGDDTENGESADPGDGDSTADPEGSGGLDGQGETITLGFIPSWTDGLSTAYLLENLLEKQGYEVEMETISEAALLYTGLAQGDYDMYPSAWPEVTHAQYMDEYGDDIEDWGTYYGNAKLTMAVPEYVDIDSIAELNDNADMFDGQIIGIEPSAGLTGVMEDSVIPEYGLDENFTLTTSSTTAMLAELQSATDSEEPVVVTLWRPFWANSEFPVKDLEDPEGALGESEGLHFLANADFASENPELGEFISTIELNDEQYGQLEDMVVNEYGEGNEPEAIEAWLEANPDVIEMP